jgi:AmiR/NasT family two-component response regulator
MMPVAFFGLPNPTADQRHAQLASAGIASTGVLRRNKLVHELDAGAPDQAIVLHAETLEELLGDEALIAQLAQCRARGPLLLWLEQASPLADDGLARALALGVQELWFGDVAPSVLRLALQWAQARWRRERARQAEFEQVQAQLNERKWVERAKGVLMQAQGMGEDEAFRLLRGAAMHAKMQMAEVSRSVIQSAQWAEAMNRSGQLRMLSQRLLKLALQRHAGVDAKHARELQGEAAARIEDNLAFLAALHDNNATAQSPLAATIGPSLSGVQRAWAELQAVLGPAQQKTPAQALVPADERAEALLDASEALTQALESTGGRRGLNVVNLCGRQRMRVQRLAKEALLAGLWPERAQAGPRLAETAQAFEQTLLELEVAPLSSAEIRDLLRTAREQWLHLMHSLRGAASSESRATLCGTSESLLDTFDRLTACYEHSLQVILG